MRLLGVRLASRIAGAGSDGAAQCARGSAASQPRPCPRGQPCVRMASRSPSPGGQAHAHSGARLLGTVWTGEPHVHTAQRTREAAPRDTHWVLLWVEGPLVCGPWRPLLLLGLSLGEVGGDAAGPAGCPLAPPSRGAVWGPQPSPSGSSSLSCRSGSVGSQVSQRKCSKYRCTFAVFWGGSRLGPPMPQWTRLLNYTFLKGELYTPCKLAIGSHICAPGKRHLSDHLLHCNSCSH